MVRAASQLRLLLWKNYLVKRRAASATLSEVAASCAFFIVFQVARIISPEHPAPATSRTFSEAALPGADVFFASDVFPPFPPFGYGSEPLVWSRARVEEWEGHAVGAHAPCLLFAPAAHPNVSAIAQRIQGMVPPAACVVRAPDDASATRFYFAHPSTVWAVVSFTAPRADGGADAAWRYSIRINGTYMPSTEGTEQLAVRGGLGGASVDAHERYVSTGFLTIQRMVDDAIAAEAGLGGTWTGRTQGMALRTDPTSLPSSLDRFFSGFFVNLSCGFLLGSAMAAMLYEKASRLKEVMVIMGLSEGVYLAHWVLTYSAVCAPAALLFTLAFRIVRYTTAASNFGLVWLFVFLYLMATVASGFAASAFLAKSESATTVSFLLTFLLSLAYLPALVFDAPTTLRTVLSLVPTCAMINGAETIRMLEGASLGVAGATLSESGNFVAFGPLLAVTAASVPLWLLLSWYLSQVVPDAHGEARPWHFPVTSWCSRAARPGTVGIELPVRDAGSAAPSAAQPAADAENFEAHPLPASQASLVTRDLHKVFRAPGCSRKPATHAVDGLNVALYRGEIFALLGHNGAGKSTSIGIMTGAVPPSSGAVSYDGRDVREVGRNFESGPRIGVCPQQNMLFPQLTAREHIQLFAGIKGVPPAQVQQQVDAQLALADLLRDADRAVGRFSGGMKRKVAMAMALVGDPTHLFLDEPTAGMDPHSRRQVWRMIEAGKERRVTVLTTHFMDEADLLGDRIGIMSRGRLYCCGTSLFLKARFGIGYTLSLVARAPAVRADELRRMVRDAVPGAEELEQRGLELAFTLPLAATQHFAPFFRQLDARLAQLGLQHYALRLTTLEEVFLRTAEQSHDGAADATFEAGPAPDLREIARQHSRASLREVPAAEAGSAASGGRRAAQPASGAAEAVEADGVPRVDKSPPGLRRLLGVVVRAGWLNLVRDSEALVFSVMFPVVYVLIAFLLARAIERVATEPPPLQLSYGLVGQRPTLLPFVQSNGSAPVPAAVAALAAALAGGAGIAAPTPAAFPTLTSLWERTLALSSALQPPGTALAYVGLVGGDLDNATLLHNTSMPAALPVALNALSNTRLAGAGTHLRIETSSHPLPYASSFDAVALLLPMFVGMAFISAALASALSTVSERERKIKHLLHLMGLPPRVYWLGQFVFATLLLLPLSAFTTAFIYLFRVRALQGAGLGGWLALVATFPLSVLPFVFAVCWQFDSVRTATQLFPTALNAISIMPFVAITLLQQSSTQGLVDASRTVGDLLCFVPTYSMLRGLGKLVALHSAASAGVTVGQVFSFGDGIGAVIAISLANFVIYMALLVFLEWRASSPDSFAASAALRGARAAGEGATNPVAPGSSVEPGAKAGEDADVAAERELAREMAMQRRDQLRGTVVLEGLFKLFKTPGGGEGGQVKVAVNNMTLTVGKGELFCLLGHNGAGKTTTISVLTGDIPPTSVSCARLSGYDLRTEARLVSTVTGYCPQFDATWEVLTVREHLALYAAIKGVPPAHVERVVGAAISELGLQPYADVRSKSLSGGNRRKLSTAVALLASPEVVFLDEPSTGMDPATRRSLWDVLLRQRAHRAMLLTTHSMEEADALASRICIMAGGRALALGSVMHLKAKFGRGFYVELSGDPEHTQDMVDAALRAFPGAELLEHVHGICKLNVPAAAAADGPALSLGAVFAAIEQFKARAGVQFYSVAQTSVEQIFLRFTREAAAEAGGQ